MGQVKKVIYSGRVKKKKKKQKGHPKEELSDIRYQLAWILEWGQLFSGIEWFGLKLWGYQIWETLLAD